MTTIVFLGLRRPLLEAKAEIDAALDLGFKVILLFEGKKELGFTFEGDIYYFDGKDFLNSTLKILRETKIDAVVCWSDAYVYESAQLSEILDCLSIGVVAATKCRNKYEQRKLLPSHLNPNFWLQVESDDIRNVVKDIHKPWLAKPVTASGGRGVFDKPSSHPTQGSFIVEEKMNGTEHSLAAFSYNKQVFCYALTDKTLNSNKFRPNRTIYPSISTDHDVLVEAAKLAIESLKLGTTGVHVDLMMTEHGPKILEIGGRLGGDLINSHLIPLATNNQFQPYHELLLLLTSAELPKHTPECVRFCSMTTIKVNAINQYTRHMLRAVNRFIVNCEIVIDADGDLALVYICCANDYEVLNRMPCNPDEW